MMTVDDSKVFSDLLNTILNAILLIEGGGDGGKRIDALNYNKNLIHGKTHQQQKKHRMLLLLLLLMMMMMMMMKRAVVDWRSCRRFRVGLTG